MVLHFILLPKIKSNPRHERIYEPGRILLMLTTNALLSTIGVLSRTSWERVPFLELHKTKNMGGAKKIHILRQEPSTTPIFRLNRQNNHGQNIHALLNTRRMPSAWEVPQAKPTSICLCHRSTKRCFPFLYILIPHPHPILHCKYMEPLKAKWDKKRMRWAQVLRRDCFTWHAACVERLQSTMRI